MNLEELAEWADKNNAKIHVLKGNLCGAACISIKVKIKYGEWGYASSMAPEDVAIQAAIDYIENRLDLLCLPRP